MIKIQRKLLRPLEHALVTSMCEYVAKSKKHKFFVRPCMSKQDVLDTFTLNYKRYLEKGYCSKNDSELLFSKHNLNSCSRTFLLDYEEQIGGAITLFEDGEIGLPLESLYKNEVRCFRAKGYKLAEVGALSLNSALLGFKGKKAFRSLRRMSALFSLFKIMGNYALYRELTHLVIVVNPRHEELYRFFNFVPFGEIKYYDSVNGAPALPMILKLNSTKSSNKFRKFFFENMYDKSHFRGMYYWTDEDLLNFSNESKEAGKHVKDLFSMRRFAKVTGKILHSVTLRDTFLCA